MSAGGHVLRNRISLRSAGEDLNNLLIPGVYVLPSPANAPSPPANFVVEVYVALVPPHRFVTQRALSLTSGVTSLRIFDGTTWGSWTTFGSGGGGTTTEVANTVRLASTANVAVGLDLMPGGTLDGVTLVDQDLVLLKDQSASEENGAYVVDAVPYRMPGFDTFETFPGALFTIQEGDTNADTLWQCASNRGGVIDVDSILFVKVESSAGDSENDDETRTASGSVSKFHVVVENDDGTVSHMDSTDITHAYRVLGVALQNASDTDVLTVRLAGKIKDGALSFASAGQPVWGDTNAALTETPPASPAVFSLLIGSALATDTLLIRIERAIELA